MKSGLYILDANGVPQPTEDVAAWGVAFQDSAARTVCKTQVSPAVEVSTVFIGIDHSFLLGGPPVLFETLVFGGDHDGLLWRYETREQAIIGHAAAVAEIESGQSE